MSRDSATSDAAVRIAGWIVAGRFVPGAALPVEQALGDELGVSRTVVREAIKSLAAKGMVIAGPRLGTRVRPFADWNMLDSDVLDWRVAAGVDASFVRDLLELRLAIEPTAARLAARSAATPDLVALAAAYERMVAAVKGRGRYLDADLDFHRCVLAASHNQFLVALAPAFSAFLRVSFRLSVKDRRSAAASLPAHRRLLDAIAAHDERKAERATAQLIETARADIEANIDADDGFLLGAA
jgi:DNA-binding FadR family transcriptional regulator